AGVNNRATALSTIVAGYFARYRYPDWLRTHSLVVGAVATRLAEAHLAAGHDVDVRTVALGAYLHDIGKSPLLAGDGREHHVLGPLVLAAEGLVELCQLARRHPVYAPRDPATAPRSLAEQIVYYADRRGGLRARGANVWRDAAANVYGRFGEDSGPAILVGSHIDSVPEGGRFDGALGVLCAVEAVDALLDDGVRFRRPVEVVGWCDEEGARFGIGLFGSYAAFGRLPDGAAQRADKDGVTIADALRAIGESGDPTTATRETSAIAAYLELHIEQAPRLADRGV